MSEFNRRDFVATSTAATVALSLAHHALGEEPLDEAMPPPMGPLLGHVEPTKAVVWYRAAQSGEYELHVTEPGGTTRPPLLATTTVDNDLCVTWRIDALKPGHKYQADVFLAEAKSNKPLTPGCVISTPKSPSQPARVVLAMGSCASSTKFFDIWDQMAEQGADGVVLLGDTPYIDKPDLNSNRLAHREFLSIPNLQALVRTRPLWATWDDHDFGSNDSVGKRCKTKDQIRQAFIEYRGLQSYGNGKEGIYTRFQYGPLEVFLLDPRYFSQTAPSPVDPEQPTCLGKDQWEWLLAGLAASTAPFKLVASGMIWDDKKNKEKDDWETYAHEREALFDFIADKKISGVVLIGGDIHVSRHLRYPLKERLGYDLQQWIVSPLHERIIPELNVPHPALLWGEPIPNVFLQVIADSTKSPATLTANWITRAGKQVHSVHLTANDLAAG